MIAGNPRVVFLSTIRKIVAARSLVPPIACMADGGGASVPRYHIVRIGSSAAAENDTFVPVHPRPGMTITSGS